MLWKLVFIAALAVGAFGRTVFDSPSQVTYDPYDDYADKMAAEYCKTVNNTDKTPEVKASIKSFTTCVVGLFDSNDAENEFEMAQRTGVYSSIIKKYCAVAPPLKECISDLVKGMAPCLPPGQVENQEKSIFAILDFACDNDGARIESFIKEGGLQCVQAKQYDLLFCQIDIRTNVTKIINLYGGGPASALLIPEKEKCTILDQGLTCFVKALKGCSNPTPGEMAQELIDVYLSSLSCTGEKPNHIEVAPGKVNVVAAQLSGPNKEVEQLMKRKLELEVRTAELEIWNRENELNVQHTGLTSDIKHI